MLRSNAGFSALEMLLAVLTIAVLASVLMTVLHPFLPRAKVAEGLALAAQMRSEMALYYASYGEWPDHETLANTTQLKREGQYTRALVLEEAAITLTIETPEMHQLSLRPVMKNTAPHSFYLLCGYAQKPLGWRIAGENHSDMPASYLPYLCR